MGQWEPTKFPNSIKFSVSGCIGSVPDQDEVYRGSEHVRDAVLCAIWWCVGVKVKGTILHEECWLGAHLPYLGLETIGG